MTEATHGSLMIEYTETPNPNTMKFYAVGFLISPEALIEFDRTTENIKSNLAKDLLGLEYIENVAYSYDSVSISKNPSKSWQEILSEIIFTILRHEYDIVNNSLLSFTSEEVEEDAIQFDEKDQRTVSEITELLNETVRPQIAMDGGDIQLKAYKDGIVYLKLKGACSSAPNTNLILYQQIREMLVTNIPDVVDVENI